MIGTIHLGVLSIGWVLVSICTIVFLVVSAVTILPKMKVLPTLSVLAIFIVAAGITAYGSLHPPVAFTTSPAAVNANSTEANPVGLVKVADTTTVPGPALNNSGPKVGHVIFTFDDGPDIYTPSVLAELKVLHIPGAIFFDIGMKSAERPTLVQEEVADGDIVGNHTWNHLSFTGTGTNTKPLPKARVADELTFTNDAITAAGAPTPTLFRPPYGAINAKDVQIAAKHGLRLVMDSSNDNTIVDSNDWSGIPPQQIASQVEASLSDYAGTPASAAKHGGTRIVAFHDGVNTAPNTILALPLIVAWMNAHNWGSTLVLPKDTTGQILAGS